MKKTALAVLALLISQSAFSENIIKTYAPIKGSSNSQNNWVSTDSVYGDWVKSGALYGCSAAVPSADAYVQGVSFQQTVSDCSQDYTRNIQPREVNTVTGALRDSGVASTEGKTETGISMTQTTVGTRSELEVLFGGREGRSYLSSTNTTYVGMYSRATPAPATSIGDVQYTKGGDRIQMYFTITGKPAASGTCYVKFGASGVNGWEAGKTATASAKAYISPITKVIASFADGSTRTYTLGALTTSEGGAIRQASASCADVYAFYNNPGYMTKATLVSN